MEVALQVVAEVAEGEAVGNCFYHHLVYNAFMQKSKIITILIIVIVISLGVTLFLLENKKDTSKKVFEWPEKCTNETPC